MSESCLQCDWEVSGGCQEGVWPVLVRSPDPNNSLFYTLPYTRVICTLLSSSRVIRVRGGDPIWAANENILLEFSAPKPSRKLEYWNYRCSVHHFSNDWCLDDLVYQEESKTNHLWWFILKMFAPFRKYSCSPNLYHSWIYELSVKRFLNAVKLLLTTTQWRHFLSLSLLKFLFLQIALEGVTGDGEHVHLAAQHLVQQVEVLLVLLDLTNRKEISTNRRHRLVYASI